MTSTSTRRKIYKREKRFLSGLTLAGVASAVLTTLFELLHVDTFLTAYKLPLQTYALGSAVFSVLNTANDVIGAWYVDSLVASSSSNHEDTAYSRGRLVGLAGCLYAGTFLTPFFRPHVVAKSTTGAGLHFVTSVSLYDTTHSFMYILLGSMVTDDVHMADEERVPFMAQGKLWNLIASFFAARVGLAFFDPNRLWRFHLFLLSLAGCVCFLFIRSQKMMTSCAAGPVMTSSIGDDTSDVEQHSRRHSHNKQSTKKLQFRRVILEFWNHRNFRAWIMMEMLLECQNNFGGSFLKTFVDGLLLHQENAASGLSRVNCDWIISMVGPLSQVAGILCYGPIRRRGYQRLYMFLFQFKIVSAFLLYLLSHTYNFEGSNSTYALSFLALFIVSTSVLTSAVQSAGFHLAMSDMVLEMKWSQVREKRFGEPSLAALFMGANALLCKPMNSFLPIVAASFLENAGGERRRSALLHLLMGPPIVFSVLQMWAWSDYSLSPERTRKMRHELDDQLLNTHVSS